MGSACQRAAPELHADDKQTFRQEYGVFDDGINGLIRSGYELLGLISFFTTGEVETRAWTIARETRRSPAPIHSDFRDKFIRAEVINWSHELFGSWLICQRASSGRCAPGKDMSSRRRRDGISPFINKKRRVGSRL